MKIIIPTIALLTLVVLSAGFTPQVEEAAWLRLDTNSISVGPDATEKIVKVSSNVNWVGSSHDIWCFSGPSKGQSGTTEVTLSFAPNTSKERRESTITFTTFDNTASQTLTISQGGAGTKAIAFKDAAVKRICVANFDKNSDGEISNNEAEAVTALGTIFKNNSTITSFDELQYFTSLTSIGDYAFSICSSLKSITIPNGVTSIGYGAFYSCISLTSITIPNGVTSIGDVAFMGCSKLTSITIPNSVTSIGDSAFSYCSSLTSITIPNSVTEIKGNPFRGCSGLASFKGKFAGSDGRCLIIDNTIVAFAPAGLTSYSIPSGITSIGYAAFADCDNLTSITIPSSVTTLGNSTFVNCSSLTSITIPNGVTSIGDLAFGGCGNITSLTIPNSVTSIGNQAFSHCRSLTSIYCRATTPPNLGTEVFDENPAGRKIYVPYNSASAYRSATNWSTYASDIVAYNY